MAKAGLLAAGGLDGCVLVFMPGVGEIRRTADGLEPIARPLGWRVLELSGARSLEDQQRALSLAATERWPGSGTTRADRRSKRSASTSTWWSRAFRA